MQILTSLIPIWNILWYLYRLLTTVRELSPQRMAFQRIDDALARFNAQTSAKDQTLTLTKNDDNELASPFHRTASGDYLVVDGSVDGHRIQMALHRKDRNQFPIVKRDFTGSQRFRSTR